MQTFFAIMKSGADRDYCVTLITSETIFTLVEQELSVEIRRKCEEHTGGAQGLALTYLNSCYPLVKLYNYDIGGAMLFLAGAHGVGTAEELRAAMLVQDMRKRVDRMIEKSLNAVRVDLMQKQIDIADGADKAHCISRVAHIMETDADGLLEYFPKSA